MVENMLITEQDKFSGMTRGLAKTGGRQSRGDSWVCVSFSLLESLPFDILWVIVISYVWAAVTACT